MTDFFKLYDALIQEVDSREQVTSVLKGTQWTSVETSSHFGIAMTTPCDTVPALLAGDYIGLPLHRLAEAAKSWNLTEAGYGMAAINAYYNTPRRLAQLNAHEPFDHYCTHGLDLQNNRIGVVGHLNMPDYIREQAADIYILERNPRPGDYPDSACDWLLPRCDIVLITASTLVNKTLPHLLELCKNAYTILTGPSCPMCPALLDFGIDRLAGLVITDTNGMRQKIQQDISGHPYSMGAPFLLKRECL